MHIQTKENLELRKLSTFKIGGAARRAFFPKSMTEFTFLLKNHPEAIILGGLSNVLISSRGINGDIILTNRLDGFSIEVNETVKQGKITAQCGVKTPFLAQKAAEQSLSGMEFMIGFPGTVGGVVFMNASAHNQSVADIFESCTVFDIETAKELTLNKEEIKFAYRKSIFQEKKYALLEAVFLLPLDNMDFINEIMRRNSDFRKLKQPSLKEPNIGSIFKNPENDSAGRLLDRCGFKGEREGGAIVWHDHANFIVNAGDATSDDVLNLMFRMHSRVKEHYKINLTPEIKFAGEMSDKQRELWNLMLTKE